MHAAHRSRTGPAWGVGIETITADATVLDTWYPEVFVGDTEGALRLKESHGHVPGEGSHRLDRAESLDALRVDLDAITGFDRIRGVDRRVVVTFIEDLASPPIDAHDVHLRFHLLSRRLVQPGTIDLTGFEDHLVDVVWTDHGACSTGDVDRMRLRMLASGRSILVHGVGPVVRMIDHVIPPDVRIVDGDRVLLGAHLAPGTVVGATGFCGPDSGTVGAAVIHGHLGPGVTVAEGSEVAVGSRLEVTLGRKTVVGTGVHLHRGSRVQAPDGGTSTGADLEGADEIVLENVDGSIVLRGGPLGSRTIAGEPPERPDQPEPTR